MSYATHIISGLQTAKNGVSGIDFAAGATPDDTGAAIIEIDDLLTKTEAAWASGHNAGGLDAGSTYTADTWYWCWAIRHSTSESTDALLSLSKTSPTLPTGYDEKSLIWAFETDSSGDIINYRQDGDQCTWLPRRAGAAVTLTKDWTLWSMDVPPLEGTVCKGQTWLELKSSGSRYAGFSSGLVAGPPTVWDAEFLLSNDLGANGRQVVGNFEVLVNGNGQIQYAMSKDDLAVLSLNTIGWTFPRGRVKHGS